MYQIRYNFRLLNTVYLLLMKQHISGLFHWKSFNWNLVCCNFFVVCFCVHVLILLNRKWWFFVCSYLVQLVRFALVLSLSSSGSSCFFFVEPSHTINRKHLFLQAAAFNAHDTCEARAHANGTYAKQKQVVTSTTASASATPTFSFFYFYVTFVVAAKRAPSHNNNNGDIQTKL